MSHMRKFQYSTISPIICLSLISITLSCVDIQGPTPQQFAPNEILSQVLFSTRAVMMNISDTLSLSVRAIYMDGSQSLVPADSVKWRSQDSAQVYIDRNGVITALKESSTPVGVIASYIRSGTTKSDTIPVYVTETRLSADGIRLVSIDSTNVGASPPVEAWNPRIRIDLYKGQTLVVKGARIPLSIPSPMVATYLSTGGPDGEPVYAIVNNRGYLGPLWIKGSVMLYGSEVKDSVLYKGVYPASGVGIAVQSNDNGEILPATMLPDDPVLSMQPCGWVFIALMGRPGRNLDIVFSDSLSSADGCSDIPVTTLNQFRWFGIVPIFDHIVGGNLYNVTIHGPLESSPFSDFRIWLRRSSSVGEIHYFVRDAITGDSIPVSGRFRQIAVN